MKGNMNYIDGGIRIAEVSKEPSQMAAESPADKPRKIVALFTVLFPYLASGWSHVPNTISEVHCDETRTKVFDIVPATMRLVQKPVLWDFVHPPVKQRTCLCLTFFKRGVKKQRISIKGSVLSAIYFSQCVTLVPFNLTYSLTGLTYVHPVQ